MQLHSTLGGLHHVGIVVKNLEEGIGVFRSLGMELNAPALGAKVTKREVLGKAVPVDYFRFRSAFGKIGHLTVQIIEPGEQESTWKEFLDKKGEGVHHIAFSVEDIDYAETEFARGKVTVLQRQRSEGGGGACLLGTDRIGGVFIELIQKPGKVPKA